MLEKERREAYYKLINGLKEIKIVYKNEDWKDKRENLFLELFSKLHVDEKFYHSKFRDGYYLLNENNDRRCLYDFKNDNFWLSYRSVWRAFKLRFDMNYDDIQSFMNKKLRKYFKLYNVTAGQNNSVRLR